MQQKSSKKISGSFFIILFFLVLAGCYTAKDPLYKSETFNQEKINTICVLPVVDLRFDKKKELRKLDKWVHEIVEDKLKDKKYECELISDRDLVNKMTEEDVKSINPEWIKTLGPSCSKYVMLIALWDARSKLTFGSTGNAEVSLYLFDKQNGITIWKDKDIAQVGAWGITGMFLKGSMLGDAVKETIRQMMTNFPKKDIKMQNQ